MLYLLRIAVEVGVRLPDQALNGGAIDVGNCLIGQGETAMAILGEDQVRIDVDHLSQEGALLQKGALAFLPFGDVDHRDEDLDT